MHQGRRRGEDAFLLDGFPRTAVQAETLTSAADVRVAVNMTLREDVSFFADVPSVALTRSRTAAIKLYLGNPNGK